MLLVAAIYAVSETLWFGSNTFPMSIHELLCDMTAWTLCVIGLFWFYEIHEHTYYEKLRFWLVIIAFTGVLLAPSLWLISPK